MGFSIVSINFHNIYDDVKASGGYRWYSLYLLMTLAKRPHTPYTLTFPFSVIILDTYGGFPRMSCIDELVKPCPFRVWLWELLRFLLFNSLIFTAFWQDQGISISHEKKSSRRVTWDSWASDITISCVVIAIHRWTVLVCLFSSPQTSHARYQCYQRMGYSMFSHVPMQRCSISYFYISSVYPIKASICVQRNRSTARFCGKR